MDRSLSQQATKSRQAGAQALALRLPGMWQPYMFLSVVTLIVLIAAYSVRPVVRVDMGGNHDSVFLTNFNAREIDSNGSPETLEWPRGARTLSFPGGRKGVWMLTLYESSDYPAGILGDVAVAVNGERVDMPRRTANTLIAKIPAHLAAMPQITVEMVSPLVGDPEPFKDVAAKAEIAPARTYRWTRDESSLFFPGLGRGAWALEMTTVTTHPDGLPLNAQVFANDTLIATLPDSPAPRRVRLIVPAAVVGNGDLEVTIRSKVFTDPRELGVLLSDVTLAPVASGALAAFPPLTSLGFGLVAALLAYASLASVSNTANSTVSGWQRRLREPIWLAAFGVALALAFGAWFVATFRYPSSFMFDRLAALALFSLLLTLALRPVVRWMFRACDEPIPDTYVNTIMLIFLLGFWSKAIGMIYPFFVAIDVQWHMDKARRILGGELPLFYGVSSPLNEITMPTAEWGENRPVIPYSPYFHMFATLYAFFPGLKMETVANFFSLITDATRVPIIALLALKAGLSRRGALIAAVTYLVLPVTFLLHSWGNVPTSFGLWLTLLVNTFIIAGWKRLGERAAMVSLSLIMTLTFLIYTVTGVFLGVFLVGFTILAWLNAKRGGEWRSVTAQLRSIWIAAGVAIGVVLLIYYGQYIPPILERTVPYLSTVFTQGPESVGVQRPPFAQYLWSFVPHLDYYIWPGDYLYFGVAIPLLFVIPGFLALRDKPLIWVGFATWFSVGLVFLLVGYRISMVDKQLFYILPLICICWAIYADRFWERGGWQRWIVIVVLLFSLVSAIDQWILRIATSPVL